MRTDSYRKAEVAGPRPLSPALLESQWAEELYHCTTDFDVREVAFHEKDWIDWEWNAKEALHLNSQYARFPAFLGKWLRPQTRINFHLLLAFQKMLSCWRQWEKIYHDDQSATGYERSSTPFLLLSAIGRLDQANVKQDSLNSQRIKFLQAPTLRQQRFYQYLSAMLSDLTPVVKTAWTSSQEHENNPDQLLTIREALDWHAKELRLHVKLLDHRASLLERIRCPYTEINRLLGTACTYHAKFLRTLLKFQI